ncbi:hypothetical protein AX769_17420 [Frondihabitans sp. PAMC 28766]|uniref:alpha-L-fucosidase n=1 Tax=Frondihabitans sp. PAMC 28766 TaxID=1795630 RepID=UPI00078DE6CA|nr:alpha-amylase family protein [Frondihabitans sp. PAMC 28766]AMM21595.1 hypothetical protein AX769_17420 [Frondihabitans sp. PAMC 28766]
MTELFFPKRTVHLDFHTGPQVPGVGAKFDPEAFADTFARADVDSVTVFAKCHHGHLYYDTDRPERHPGLARDLDLLEQQIEALHSRGIRAPIYVSVQCDEYAANLHPDWIAMDGLEQVKWSDGTFDAGWQILDMSSPYQDFLAEQVQEVIDRFAPLDGLFLDMCWDQPSTSVWAKRGMQDAGRDPESVDDRAVYARQVAHQYMQRFQAMVEPHLDPEVASGVWFNSRPKTALDVEEKFLRHIEIEALPSGGWGYSFFPYTARFVRPLGKPTLSHTGRFHMSWGDNGGLKPKAALHYETSQILSQGLTSGVGDLLAPSGELNPAIYDLVGSAYHHVKACEPFIEGASVRTEAALVIDPALGDTPGPSGIGALRGLQQLRVQFDIVPPSADLSRYELVVVPETTAVTGPLADSLAARAAAGASILISRGADSGSGERDELSALGVLLGDDLPYSHVFLRPTPAIGGSNGFDHVIYRRGVTLEPTGDAEVLCQIVTPYFEREWDHFSGHSYTPSSGEVFSSPAVVQVGSVIVTGVPLLSSIATDAAPAFRDLLRALVDRLLPRPLVRAGGPVHLETSVMTTPSRAVLHLTSFVSTRSAEISGAAKVRHTGLDLVEDPFPLVEVDVALRVDQEIAAVHLQPDGLPLDHTVEDGYLKIAPTILNGHAMVVVDYAVDAATA